MTLQTRRSRALVRALSTAVVVVTLTALTPFARGQSAPAKSEGQEEKISHEGIAPKGNTVHHFFSADREKKYRKQQANTNSTGFNCSNPPVAGNCSGAALVYNGGPVMRNPTNYLIFWNPQAPTGNPNVSAGFPAGFKAGIENFFQNLSGTPFYNIVTQYNDKSGSPVPNSESLGAPSWVDNTTVAPSGCDGTPTGAVAATPHCPLADSDIQNEVKVALAANPTWLQPPQINVEYFVFTPTGIGECSNQAAPVPPATIGVWQCFAINGGVGPNENGAFCAYHSAFSASSTSGTIYAYEPFASDGNCHSINFGFNTPNFNNFPNGAAVDIQLSPVSHEMVESNTDPLPGINTAWQGPSPANGSDEIGDKCAYVYGFIAPDGTDMVLNGNRYQIQTEFSNDLVAACGGANAPPYCACTKRYGPAPAVSVPPVTFGEVQSGASVQQTVQIQNTGEGALNILDVALSNASSCPAPIIGNQTCFFLLNTPPTAATVLGSESVTANVQFAPQSGSLFASPTANLLVDTDQTTFDPANDGTIDNEVSTTLTATVGVHPIALCKPAVVPTDPNMCSTANASVNNGSYDPDGEAVSVTQSPAGPYTLGTTNVTLTVVDNGPDLQSATCSSTVTVQDMQKPTITCPAPQTILCTSSSGAAATLNPTVFDNCPGVISSCVPPSGSTFGFGTTPATCTATDTSGNMSSCMTSVTVADVPPVIASVVASPNVLRPPNKKLDPVKILVADTDVCDPNPVCSISAVATNSGPAVAGSDYVLTGPLSLELRASGNGGHALTYIVSVTCEDHHGGRTTAQTTVQAPL